MVWDGSAAFLIRLHLVGVAVRVRLVAVTFVSAHALVLPRFVADITELVDGVVDALVPDICGGVFVEVDHALGAVFFAHAGGECGGSAANNDLTHIFFFIIHEGIVFGPLHVADDCLGIQGRAFVGASLVGKVVVKADMVGADSYSHLVLKQVGERLQVVSAHLVE